MIDFVKLKIVEGNPEYLLSNPTLEFKRMVSERTGELSSHTNCTYHFCKITIYDNGIILFSGSIHKMFNSLTKVYAPNMKSNKQYKGYNGNQFSWNEIAYVRNHLVKLFRVSPIKIIVQNIEFGQNLNVSFNPKDLIKNLLFFEGKSFEHQFQGYFAKSVHSQYIIKIYDKGNQYGMPLNTLRFEVKTLKMQFQKKHVGIKTLADFSPLSMKKAFNFLEAQLNKLLYYDPTIRKKELRTRDKNHIPDLSNPRFWQNLKPNKRDGKKKLLQRLINNHSDNLKLEVTQILKQNRVIFYRP